MRYNQGVASARGAGGPLPVCALRAPTDSRGLMPNSNDPPETPPNDGAPVGAPRTWDRINALFHEALDLDPDAREALLARTAEKEADLAIEVRSLIASHEEAGGFLETPAGMPLLKSMAPGD